MLKNLRWRGGKHDQDLLPASHPQKNSGKAVTKGSLVEWNARKGKYVGKVEDIFTSGKITQGSESLEASPEKSVARVVVYARLEDKYERTDRRVIVYTEILSELSASDLNIQE